MITAPVLRPVNTAAPTISGSPTVGDVLTVSNGTWSHSPTSYAYAWSDCDDAGASCVATRGASSSTYKLTSSDAGDELKVTVTATNAAAAVNATSTTTAVIITAAAGSVATDGIKVSGNEVVNDAGSVIHLHGVNRSGTEYACVEGWGTFDGPSDAASVAAMASWHVNIVRIPLNEDCWLGLNGVSSAYSGAAYRAAIVSYVNLLHSYGIYAELSLMWGAPGSALATYQSNAPDEDHSPAMWTSMAQTFKNDPNVVLAPWGETTVSWQCFMQGCDDQATFSSADGPFDGDASCGSGCDDYTTAGMDQAVTNMRGAGYSGPIVIPCIELANVCADPSTGGAYSGGTWLTEHPSDPDNSLIAEVHLYGGNVCDTTSCLDESVRPILTAGYPVLFGETGEYYDNSDCGTSYISAFLNWADENGAGYETWAWDSWGNCGSLVSDYAGTPANAFGSYVQSHYASLG